jgi:hypothetical protein
MNDLKDLHIEILEVLSMSPEPLEMLVDMVELEDGSSPPLEVVQGALEELYSDGLVQVEEGFGTDPAGDLVGLYWWSLTDKGREFAETRG